MEDRREENEINDTSLANDKDLNEQKKIEEPKLGMMFSSEDDGYQYYTNFALQEGFSVMKRSSKCGDDGVKRYFTFACARTRKRKSTKVSFNSRLTSKTDCLAKIRLTLQPDGMFKLTTVVLEHNHPLSPGKVLFFRRNKKSDRHVKRKIELNDPAGTWVNQNLNTIVVESGGYENVPVVEKDSRNCIEKTRRLRLGVGDAEAIRNYFVKMQDKNSGFFYLMDLDEDCNLRNIFWADARSRATYETFGDVVTFDTTYLTNKYDLPFVSFIGVNHHGQSVLLGCGLLSDENVETFVWLFESWLACMSWCPPKAIVTDQCKAMQRAVEKVFPNTRHRWCLWHIMKKSPEKLKCYSHHEAIKIALQNVVYDSLTKDEFEEGWRGMIGKYDLHDNEWLGGLYDERHRWAPIYVKDTFWAGMSTIQRGERMNAFFDGYVNSKTTLKQFVEQYDDALRSKIEKEDQADFHSFNSRYECVTNYRIEKQLQGAYTNVKFKEFQEELKGKLYCYPSIIKVEGSICIYQVIEDVEVGNVRKDVVFDVYFNEVECEAKCMCHLFEFKGILCRHSLSVLTQRRVEELPPKYILSRWRKDLKRKYSYIKSSYDDLAVKVHAQWYNEMQQEFNEVAALAVDSEERRNIVMGHIRELKNRFLSDESMCGSNQPTQIA
ncbi:hypothetical protein L1049_011117 [Liquidambar formosana]|uniref:Protein FAR1-RELATED SEQUENCE n=1 Tax=Liquidambar formosana TaxID=63359 RepID=A0AAP0WXW3_LIQFO